MPLTPQQETAVYNRGGSLLVSAAAGSGKTKVLVERLFAGPVADELVGARQRVEQCRLTAVGVARKGNFDLLFHIMLLPVQALEPICKNL